MVSYTSLIDSKSPQMIRTLLNILADLNNAVVWMVSTCSLIFKSSSLFTNPLVTVPSAPFTTGITVTFIFHSFFSSLARCRDLSFLWLSFSFTLWPAGTSMSPLFGRFIFFCWQSVCLVVWPKLGDSLVSQNLSAHCASHFSGWIVVYSYALCSFG